MASPLALFSVYSPNGTYDALFLTNYAYININDPMTRVPGIGQVQISGAGQYAMRFWVRPDTLAKLNITVNEIISAHPSTEQCEPGRPDRRRAGPRRTGVHLYRAGAGPPQQSPEEFENIIVRASPDGSIVRMKDVARVELGSQTYNIDGRLNGQPGRSHRHLPAPRLQRPRHGDARQGSSWRR